VRGGACGVVLRQPNAAQISRMIICQNYLVVKFAHMTISQSKNVIEKTIECFGGK
jgi:hypothetical protein